MTIYVGINGGNMNKEIISTDKAPRPIGPYSQAVKFGNLLFISGQLPNDPTTGEIVGTDVAMQTGQALKNVLAITEANGMSKGDVLKVTVFLRDIENYSKFNDAYTKFFENDFPARECVGVAGLPKNILVGISAICGR
jgi:2-iminobutanoate/2-iminopropanoate deaminase